MGPAYVIGQLFPHLPLRLKQAYIKEDATEYLSKTIFYALIVFAAATAVLVPLSSQIRKVDSRMMLVFAVGLGAYAFAYRLLIPGSVIKKRMGDIERNLVFALQSLYVQITSGIPLLDAMAAISGGSYGSLSDEFKVCVDEVESGVPFSEALENLARRNPSVHFQKVVFQISSTLNTGGDVANTLDHLMESLAREQLDSIRNYGSKLSPLAMAYMMAAIIVPSLGITALISASSLLSLKEEAAKKIFQVIFLLSFLMQVLFALIIRSMRPNLLSE